MIKTPPPQDNTATPPATAAVHHLVALHQKIDRLEAIAPASRRAIESIVDTILASHERSNTLERG